MKALDATEGPSSNMATRAEIRSLDPITKAFLEGVYDEECVLFKLNGLCHLLREVWGHVKKYWRDSVYETRSVRYQKATEVGDMVAYINLNNPDNYQRFPLLMDERYERRTAFPYYNRRFAFPKPKNISINMMPFILSNKFKDTCLPKYLKAYWDSLITYCILDKNEVGKVCYLTIHESEIEENSSQRRPGIHTESPGKIELRYGSVDEIDKGQGDSIIERETVYHHWGFGLYDKTTMNVIGGIFMASNIADSCRVWDCQIVDNTCIGHLGDIEHLRSFLPENEVMEPNCLYWLTDRTPHESLPLKEKTYRQFFRLVTSQVSLWFEDHSTKNPLGVVPDPNITKIVKGSKFNKGEAYIVSDQSI